MYCDFYHFNEEPFNITSDPNFLFMSPSHEEVLTSIIYGIQGRRGIIAVIGEVGTGKTTLLNTALEWLSEKTRVAYVINSDVNFEDLLRLAIFNLGLIGADETLSKVEAIQLLQNFAGTQLDEGGNVVLIVDEAQNLNMRTMENLRLLSNLETAKHKLVQIVLSGQPELESKLALPALRQFTQRIGIRRYVQPLSKKETYAYIRHRLEVAGYKGPALFKPDAQNLIWQTSGGIPRKINIICDNALWLGFRERHPKIDVSVVEKTINTLKWLPEG